MNLKLATLPLLYLFMSSVMAQSSQNDVILKVELRFDKHTLKLGEQFVSAQNDTLIFTTIKFYLSGFEIHYSDGFTFKEKNSYHLIDIDSPESLSIQLNSKSKREIKSIRFNIGVDSLASVSGAMDGDLDVTKGMYWAWQSGFINMKIEGKSSSCKTRKNMFQFHVGGYLEPNYAMRMIELPVPNIKSKINDIALIVDFGRLLSEIQLKDTNSIMIPGKEAMHLADLSVVMFSLK